jgi:excisionase family DNA binding protein
MNQALTNLNTNLIDLVSAIAEEKVASKLNELRNQVIIENMPFLCLEQVCKMTGLSKSTIYTYISKQKISYYKPCNKIFFKYEDIINFIMDEQNYYKSKNMLQSEAETFYILDKTNK